MEHADAREPAGRRFAPLHGARTRIVLAFVLLLAASGVLSVVTIERILIARAADHVDAELQHELEEFQRIRNGRDARTDRPFGADVKRIFEVYFLRNVPDSGETASAYIDGRLVHSSPPTKAWDFSPRDLERRIRGLDRPLRGAVGGADQYERFLAVPVVADGRVLGTFAITGDGAVERAQAIEAVEIVAAVLGAVLVLASVITWVVAGRVLAPLRALSETARSIGETDLTRRIAVTGNDEIAGLARTFNAMLDRLERAFHAQREFVSDASHELRTPITIIRGHIELLGEDPDERRDTVAIVTDELNRMTRFVEDLLLLAKSSRADFLRYEEVSLDALTDELAAKARALAPRRWVVDERGGATLRADRQRLTQAVMGLAQNAVQHTAEGDVIAVGSSVEDGEARIWVRDTGTGVAPADRERIFERFARAAHSARRSDGAGLGLSIVRAIAEAHAGRVELDSEPGAGSTFTLVLPLAADREPVAS